MQKSVILFFLLSLPCSLLATECGEPFTSINDIQGTGDTSPVLNKTVTVEGIVTAEFQSSGEIGGFFIQQGITALSSSSGLYIYSRKSVKVGQHLRLTGRVKEYYDLTELVEISALVRCGLTELPKAQTLTLPLTDSKLELFEGMRVKINTPVLTAHNSLMKYGQISVAQQRLFAASFDDSEREDSTAQLIIDDALKQANPGVIKIFDASLNADILRLGAEFEPITGTLTYSFGEYRLLPEQPLKIKKENQRSPAPERSDSQLRIVAFNVQNLFNGDGHGGGYPTQRGATTEAEYMRQQAKLVSAINELNPDVLVLSEIENDGFSASSAVRQLAKDLNFQVAIPDSKRVGAGAIQNAILYRRARVSSNGPLSIIDKMAVPSWSSQLHRPAIAQTFVDERTGQLFTIVANHFRSKSGRCPKDTDHDIEKYGACNQARVQAARSVAAWLKVILLEHQQAILMVGDFNAYAHEPPILEFEKQGYTLLSDQENDYSYVYQGVAGALDHALANEYLLPSVARAGYWHINADEIRILDYNSENKPAKLFEHWRYDGPHRSSDHDPLIVDLNFNLR